MKLTQGCARGAAAVALAGTVLLGGVQAAPAPGPAQRSSTAQLTSTVDTPDLRRFDIAGARDDVASAASTPTSTAGAPRRTQAAPTAKGRHIVYVRVAADEEWRRQFGKNWKKAANAELEKADNQMIKVFGINLRARSYVGYTSSDKLRDGCALLHDMRKKVRRGAGNDIVVGFLGQGTAGGCAFLNGTHTVILRSNRYAEWKVVRHEVSHLFAAEDRYHKVAGDNPKHKDDVMEDPYDHPSNWASPDRGIIMRHRAKFDD